MFPSNYVLSKIPIYIQNIIRGLNKAEKNKGFKLKDYLCNQKLIEI
jgi:hypothetical protein